MPVAAQDSARPAVLVADDPFITRDQGTWSPEAT